MMVKRKEREGGEKKRRRPNVTSGRSVEYGCLTGGDRGGLRWDGEKMFARGMGKICGQRMYFWIVVEFDGALGVVWDCSNSVEQRGRGGEDD